MKGIETIIKKRSSMMIDGMIRMRTRIKVGLNSIIIIRDNNITDHKPHSVITQY